MITYKNNECEYIAAFDICDDKRRNKINKILEEYGRRVQKSVYLIAVTKKQQDKLCNRLSKCVEKEEDILSLYKICDDSKNVYIGKAEERVTDSFIII